MGQFCPMKYFQMSVVSFAFYVRGADGEMEGEEEECEGKCFEQVGAKAEGGCAGSVRGVQM